MPDHLGISTQPVGGNATGTALTTQPVIQVYDAWNNPVGSATNTITASIASGDGNATISAGATKAAVGGVATFSGLALIATPLSPYTLTFSATGLTSVTSNSISVTHAPATQLLYVTQPAGGNATGEDFSTQPVLRLLDQYGNLVASDNSSTITAHIASGSGATLSNVTATSVGGIVTFAHLRMVGVPGTQYKLNFTTASLTSADSTVVSVTNAVASQLVITQASATARAGLSLIHI